MHTQSTRNHARTTRRVSRGFTLIEILVVVTIIALLAGMIGWKVFGALGKSRQSVARAEAASIANALQEYSADTGARIEDGMDLGVLLLGPEDGNEWGPYLTKKSDEALMDPWGNFYVVRVPGEVNAGFDIVSYGADGQPGGTGENADVTQ